MMSMLRWGIAGGLAGIGAGTWVVVSATTGRSLVGGISMIAGAAGFFGYSIFVSFYVRRRRL